MYISFSLVPISHLILSSFCWFSFLIYFRLLYIIHRLRQKEFKSSFFLIIRLQAITDTVMFLYVELIARPRKYRIHSLFEPLVDHWLPQLLYVSLTIPKDAMFIGYVVVALNRCSEIFRLKNHFKLWTPSIIIIIYLSEWILPSMALLPLFYSGNHNFSLLNSSSGGLLLRANPDFMKIDALQDMILSTLCCVTSSILYFFTFMHLIKEIPKTLNLPNLTSRSLNPPTDLIIFKCAFFSFVLFTPNAIKTVILYFATNPTIIDIGTELWFFTTELMCISSPWSLLFSSSRLREEFLPRRFRRRRRRREEASNMMSTLF